MTVFTLKQRRLTRLLNFCAKSETNEAVIQHDTCYFSTFLENSDAPILSQILKLLKKHLLATLC